MADTARGPRSRRSRPRADPRQAAGQVYAECFMFCDGVHAANQKLYTLGGGWDRLFVPKIPTEHLVHVAVRLVIPWVDANQPLPLRMEVRDEDGQLAIPEPMRAEVEVGRPPGVVPGDPLAVALPIQVRMPIARQGRFTFTLFVRDQPVARAAFRAVLLQPGMAPPGSPHAAPPG